MTKTTPNEWDQYGLIAELALRMAEREMSLGKTALQKFVFFLQNLFNVDCGYKFSLYTFGPFSSALLNDLDIATLLGAVKTRYERGTFGYKIEPGDKAQRFRKKAGSFLAENSDAIESVIDFFGNRYASELELRATAVFADHEARAAHKKLSRTELVDIVSELKPGFPREEIQSAVDELRDAGYVLNSSVKPKATFGSGSSTIRSDSRAHW